MGELFSILLFIGLCFLMMRFGCGGHWHHKHRNKSNVDPVCGMTVNSGQGYTLMHEGRPYRFCTRSCLNKFESDPKHYLPLKGGRAD